MWNVHRYVFVSLSRFDGNDIRTASLTGSACAGPLFVSVEDILSGTGYQTGRALDWVIWEHVYATACLELASGMLVQARPLRCLWDMVRRSPARRDCAFTLVRPGKIRLWRSPVAKGLDGTSPSL